VKAGGIYNGIDRHSGIVVNAAGIIEYITPATTTINRRISQHQDEIIAKIEELINTTSVQSPNNKVPDDFTLQQNSPNPFQTRTNFNFSLNTSSSGVTKLIVYDILGREIRTLFQKNVPSGSYTASWDGLNRQGQKVASGIYFYALQTGGKRTVRRMILIAK